MSMDIAQVVVTNLLTQASTYYTRKANACVLDWGVLTLQMCDLTWLSKNMVIKDMKWFNMSFVNHNMK